MRSTVLYVGRTDFSGTGGTNGLGQGVQTGTRARGAGLADPIARSTAGADYRSGGRVLRISKQLSGF